MPAAWVTLLSGPKWFHLNVFFRRPKSVCSCTGCPLNGGYIKYICFEEPISKNCVHVSTVFHLSCPLIKLLSRWWKNKLQCKWNMIKICFVSCLCKHPRCWWCRLQWLAGRPSGWLNARFNYKRGEYWLHLVGQVLFKCPRGSFWGQGPMNSLAATDSQNWQSFNLPRSLKYKLRHQLWCYDNPIFFSE